MALTTVTDSTETEHRPALLPSHVAALGERGFRVLGRLTQSTRAGRGDYVYDRSERERLAVWRARPAATLLVAGDGSSYATVDTFGDAPVVRLRTELADGSMVETVGVGREGALLPRSGSVDALAGFTGGDAPGRSISLVEGPAPEDVVRAHAARVAAAGGSAPVRHDDRAHAVRMWQAAALHDAACAERYARSSRRAALVVWLGGSAVVLAAWFGVLAVWRDRSPLVDLLVLAAVLVVALPVLFVAARALDRRASRPASRPPFPV